MRPRSSKRQDSRLGVTAGGPGVIYQQDVGLKPEIDRANLEVSRVQASGIGYTRGPDEGHFGTGSERTDNPEKRMRGRRGTQRRHRGPMRDRRSNQGACAGCVQLKGEH